MGLDLNYYGPSQDSDPVRTHQPLMTLQIPSHRLYPAIQISHSLVSGG